MWWIDEVELVGMPVNSRGGRGGRCIWLGGMLGVMCVRVDALGGDCAGLGSNGGGIA